MLTSLVVYLKKVSLYVDEELWLKFKEAVLRKHGTLRKLSDEVESLLRVSLAGEDFQFAFERLGVKVRGAVSSEGIKQYRPKLRGPPSEQLIKKMRGRRAAEVIS